MRLSLWFAAGLSVAVVGCAGRENETGGGTTSDEPAELQIHEYFIAAEEAYCTWAAGCGGYDSLEACQASEFFDVWFQTDLLASGVFSPPADGSVRGAAVNYLLSAHEAGRIEFDGKAAAACLEYVKGRGCDRPGTYTPTDEELAGAAACKQVFSGTMVRNGPCYLGIECAAEEGVDVVCGRDPSCVDACCVGGCRVLSGSPEGSPCTNQSRCEEGTYCGFDFNTGMSTVCTKKVGAGAACPLGNECADGTYCDFNIGQCASPLKLGESCWSGTCEAGLYCGDVNGNGDQRCLEFADEGEMCAWYSNGCRALDNGCDEASHRCVKLPKAGAPCLPNSGCAQSATCQYDPFDSTTQCIARVGVGEACGERYDDLTGYYEYVGCLAGLVCDGFDLNSSKCRAPGISSVCPVPDL